MIHIHIQNLQYLAYRNDHASAVEAERGFIRSAMRPVVPCAHASLPLGLTDELVTNQERRVELVSIEHNEHGRALKRVDT